jgi:hypothetical protein
MRRKVEPAKKEAPRKRPSQGCKAISFGDGEGSQTHGTGIMGDDYVLVGSVPCRLSLELHVDGRRVSGQQRGKAGWCIPGHEGTGGRSPKRMRIMSTEG